MARRFGAALHQSHFSHLVLDFDSKDPFVTATAVDDLNGVPESFVSFEYSASTTVIN